jgi:hypothetical protein
LGREGREEAHRRLESGRRLYRRTGYVIPLLQYEGRQFIHQTWWVFAAPLAVLFATVLAFNQLGDGFRRALDRVLKR